MSKKEIVYCDACNKESKRTMELMLPILLDREYMCPYEMDICEACAERFLKLYYEIASENHSTGKHATTVTEEDEEE